MHLPIADDEQSKCAQSAVNDSQKTTAGPFVARLLVAEDNPVNQELLLHMLEQLGCKVDAVCDGKQALENLSKRTYDIVLMDCQMPELDGLVATAKWRQQEKREGRGPIPIIALTANAMAGFREQCLAVGMNDYLSKPFKLAQLQTLLARWLPAGLARKQIDQY